MSKTPPPAEVKRTGKKPDAPAQKKRDPSMSGGARGGDPDARPKPHQKIEPPIIESNVT